MNSKGGDSYGISVKEPWASCILFGGKTHENRSWGTKFRGPVLLHTSTHMDRDGAAFLREKGKLPNILLPMGYIVGRVDIVDCVTDSDSWWFCGPYGFVLKNPVAFKKPVRFKGALGFFKVPAEVVAQLENGGTL